jgi:lambda repressor-like predicted transcriptional regulator
MPAKPTKIETILKQLRRPNGASIAQLQKTVGWQPHSLRAALTGLRKKGHAIERGRDAKSVAHYCIAG